MKARVLFSAIAATLFITGCKSYPEIKAKFDAGASVAVVYKGASEITIAKDFGKTFLNEAMDKRASGELPAVYRQVTDVIAEEIRAKYTGSTVNVGTSTTADLVVEVDLAAYYDGDKVRKDCSFTVRSSLIFRDGKTNGQLRWFPKLAEQKRQGAYKREVFSYEGLAESLPPADGAEEFLQANREEMRKLLEDISRSKG